MIHFQDSVDNVGAQDLAGGFFHGWPIPPSPDTHLRILKSAAFVVIAREDEGKVVGFISAISDGISCAYISHLEVLPEYQGQGLGKKLTQLMIDQLSHLYMVDLCCDDNVVPFYEALGFHKVHGMILRNHAMQSCE